MTGSLLAGIVLGFLFTFAVFLGVVMVAIADGQRASREEVKKMRLKMECLAGRFDGTKGDR